MESPDIYLEEEEFKSKLQNTIFIIRDLPNVFEVFYLNE